MLPIPLKKIIIILLLIMPCVNLFAQPKDTVKLNYGKIYGLALNADVPPILQILDTARIVRKKDAEFKTNFENRFKYATDRTNYFQKFDTTLNPLNRIFAAYWCDAMLNNKVNYDTVFEQQAIGFFKRENGKKMFTRLPIITTKIDSVYHDYVISKGFQTADLGKTGNLYDLLVWKTEVDTTYNIPLINDIAHVNVHLMDNFVSLGWEEYATLGVYYPGGWATPASLYCVKKGYDLKSESFLVSYLSHEGQHFLDYKQFPKLSSNDLEYRAKLIELYLADKDLYNDITFFIDNSNYDKTNSHPYADFCVIRDMSRALFNNDAEKDISKWKALDKGIIHQTAKKLFMANTKSLKQQGTGVTEFIK